MPSFKSRTVPAFILALVLLAPMPAAVAQEEEASRLREIEQQLEEKKSLEQELKQKAEAAAREARAISSRLVEQAAKIREQEESIALLEDDLARLGETIAVKRADVQRQNENLVHTLAALERLSQRPPEFLLLRPADAVETVRSAMLLTTTMPEITAQTERIRASLGELNSLRASLLERRTALNRELDSLKNQRVELERLHTEKQTLYRRYTSGAEKERARIQALAREAKDLQSLIEQIEKERKAAASELFSAPSFPKGVPFSRARGLLPYPVTGTVSQRFGDDIPGGTAKGIRIETRPGTPVIAPFDGQIIFAGAFRHYGQLLIIAHGDGYHSLLAGLRRIDGEVGQWVLAGEPVGVMPEALLASGGTSAPAASADLYLEMRKNGEPLNPLPWLRK